MRSWIVAALAVIAGCSSVLSQVPAPVAGAFRRCWPAVERHWCRERVDWGIGASSRCQSAAEREYVETVLRRRWLVQWGCSADVIGPELPSD